MNTKNRQDKNNVRFLICEMCNYGNLNDFLNTLFYNLFKKIEFNKIKFDQIKYKQTCNRYNKESI